MCSHRPNIGTSSSATHCHYGISANRRIFCGSASCASSPFIRNSRRSSSRIRAWKWALRVIPVSRGHCPSSRHSCSSNLSGRRKRLRDPRSSRSSHARRSRSSRQRWSYCISRTHAIGSSARASRASQRYH